MRCAALLALLCSACGPSPTAWLEGDYDGAVSWALRPCERPAEVTTVEDARRWVVRSADGVASMCVESDPPCILGEVELDHRGVVVGAPGALTIGERRGEVENARGAVTVSSAGEMRGAIEARWYPDGACYDVRGDVALHR